MIAQLLDWPKALSHIEIVDCYDTAVPISYPVLHSLLLPHAASLKTLRLQNVGSSRQAHLLRAADFPSLETLAISMRQVEYDPGDPIRDAEALLSPSLRSFVCDFTRRNKWDNELDYGFGDLWPKPQFDLEAEGWLREFLMQAIAKRIPLTRVTIQSGTPTDQTSLGFYGSAFGHSLCDLLQRLQCKFQPHGVAMEYNRLPNFK